MTGRLLVAAALLWVAGFAHASDVLTRLDRFLAEVERGKGAFSQVVTARSGRKPKSARGEFAFERPGRFRWVYSEPYPQTLVGDGERLWSYDPELNQVSVKTIGDALGSTPAAILAGDGDIGARFELSDGGSHDGLDWAVATPRASDSPFTDMALGFRGDALVAMTIRDGFGQVTELRFEGFETNPILDNGLFRFTPPPGADVIGE
ncbi:MAG: outer membrane lipoprotein chaperone LolA [Rhodocyclaceae bacterium]|nr:outer membrane lipoprotein chaperone LolA [Rhodocyclaceae bacterium]